MSARVLELVRTAKAAHDPALLADAIPYGTWLGVRASLVESALVCRLAFSDALIGNPALPALHGGVVGALLESAALFEVLWQSESEALPKTISITIQYLRSGRPIDTFARAYITKSGRRVTSVRAEAWQDDPSKPIATAVGQLLVLT